MVEIASIETQQWRQILGALKEEFARLSVAETAWLTASLAQVADCQSQLHAFFLQAGGAQLCRDCAGDCCGCGKNHLTLVSLLGYLVAGEPVPDPEFFRSCPFLGDSGCRHKVERRPFNCVTFLCGLVEERLTPADRQAFYRLERQLRRLYGEFDRRYAGSGLCGIFIRAETLVGRPFLAPPKAV